MDELDLRILRELLRAGTSGPFPGEIKPLRLIAKKLCVSKETVRARLQGFRQRGILSGWSAMINPNLLGMNVSHVWMKFHDEASKVEAMRTIANIVNLRLMHDYLGTSISFVIAQPKHGKSLEEQLRKFENFPPIRSAVFATIKFPECRQVLTETDTKIYKAIRSNPQKSQLEIARDLAISPRTVVRRLQRLIESHSLLFVPALNPKGVEGTVMDLLLRFSPLERKNSLSKVAEFAEDCLLRIEQFEEPFAQLSIIVNNISKGKDLERYAQAQVGVAETNLFLLQDTTWFRKELQQLEIQR